MDAVTSPSNSDLDMIRLAREIAMDIQPLEKILEQYSISNETWSQLQSNTRFQTLLGSEVEAWQTALNTHERVKMKSAAMLEEWLPNLNQRMHDHEEALPAVIEAGKMLARIAGLGMPTGDTVGLGERFVINISMGPRADPLEFAKEVTSKVTIEGEATREPARANSAWGGVSGEEK